MEVRGPCPRLSAPPSQRSSQRPPAGGGNASRPIAPRQLTATASCRADIAVARAAAAASRSTAARSSHGAGSCRAIDLAVSACSNAHSRPADTLPPPRPAPTPPMARLPPCPVPSLQPPVLSASSPPWALGAAAASRGGRAVSRSASSDNAASRHLGGSSARVAPATRSIVTSVPSGKRRARISGVDTRSRRAAASRAC
eukprot:147723-Chlamydomonas_euryale.AAC.2